MTEAMIFSAGDLDALARTIYGEARGESWQGKLGVGWVVRNRATAATRLPPGRVHPLFGDGTLRSACQREWQFSCWNRNDPNRAHLLAVGAEVPVFRECLAAAATVALGLVGDLTCGATHYHTHAVSPPWSVGLKPVVTIGRHRFFRDVP